MTGRLQMSVLFQILFSFLEFIVRLPLKTIVLALNIFPSPIYEINSPYGKAERNFFVQIKGKRKLRLGTGIVAVLNSYVFKADIDCHGGKCWGLWIENFDELVVKWSL